MATPTESSVELNINYVKTPPGILRVVEVVVALAAIISGAVGSKCYNDGRFTYYLLVVSITFIEGIIILIVFVFQLYKKVPTLNVPLSLLINDTIALVMYLFACISMMLSIGFCFHAVTARVFASLFGIANFLTLVGLVYLDYEMWKNIPKETTQNSGTTVTETSPTVLA